MLRLSSHAGTSDQIDLSNLAVIKAIARCMELIEYQYRGLRASGLETVTSASLAGAAVSGGEEVDLFGGDREICGRSLRITSMC